MRELYQGDHHSHDHPANRLRISHPQLRHFINAQDPDLIYYASGHDIYCLNAETKTRTHIYHVPFDCRCTAAGYGWICVAGGDKGNFTIIQIDSSASDEATDVDALLPIRLSDRPIGRPSPGLVPPKVKVENIGGDIINSITIYKLHGDDEDASEEVVAIITSNDRTIRIYSLTYDQEVALLELPFPMNHATISPDGDLLVAVGDYNQAYFYERLDPASKEPQTWSHSKASNWEVMNIVQLHAPKDAHTLGYFTTAWSPSGSLCAVGSECGYVTIFDTELIRTTDWGEEAIVEICESTRPDKKPGPGAIRSMMFSPQPWDLLIWAEDRGRIVVADVRAGLKVRQVLKLDPSEAGVEKVETQDFSSPHSHPEASHLRDPDARAIQGQLRALTQQVESLRQYRRALDQDVDYAAATMSSEFLDILSQRRQLQRLQAVVDADPNGLTPEERQVLAALQTTDGRTEERDFGANRPRSVTYARPDGHAAAESAERRSTTLGDEFPSLHSRDVGRLPSLASIHDYVRERGSENRHLYQPRRQASVVLSTDHSGNGSSSNAASHPPTVPAHVRTTSDSPSVTDALRTIEAEWARRRSPPSYTSGIRPHTPPPPSDANGHFLSLNDSRPSTSDSAASPSPDDSPLRRRTPAFRAIEAHHQFSQLRHSTATASTSSPGPPFPHSPPPPIAVRPTSTSTTTPPSPPRLRSSGGSSRRTSNTNPRSRSRSRVSDRQVRLEDYEARVRHMARYTDPQTVGFLQRRAALYESPECGDKSAGLAMSADGGRLWCASEKGILEVKVDLWGRRVWAAEQFA